MSETLFNCPDCNKEVSKTAKVCPHCGNKKLKKQIAEKNWAEMDPKKKKMIYIGAGAFALIWIIVSVFGGSEASYSACDCANIYESENNPVNIEYSAEELNSGSKMTDDVDTWVEMARFCTIEYGNLSDVELELTKSARSIAQMSAFTRAQLNAKKKCK